MEFTLGLMEENMKAIMFRINGMEKEFIFFKIKDVTKENGMQGFSMEKEKSPFLMDVLRY